MAKQQKQKWIPNFLVPKISKKWVASIYRDQNEAWRLFSEGCLRNKRFHEAIYERGHNCLVCDKLIRAKKTKQTDKHHNDYLRLCTGYILQNGDDDIQREATNKDYPRVPDCRNCEDNNPEYFAGCVARVFPVHHACHGKIHELETRLTAASRGKLLKAFNQSAQGRAD